MQEAFADFYDSEGNLMTSSYDYAIDVVGTIFKKTGGQTHDGNGNIIPEVTQVNGWHVNVRTISDRGEELFAPLNEAYGIDPSPENPVRVWL